MEEHLPWVPDHWSEAAELHLLPARLARQATTGATCFENMRNCMAQLARNFYRIPPHLASGPLDPSNRGHRPLLITGPLGPSYRGTKPTHA